MMSNQMRRLMRKMANAHSGAQEARAPRGMPVVGPDPEYIREHQDRQRNALAERLLKIGLEECSISSFTDTHKAVKVGEGEKAYDDTAASLTLEEWYLKHAHAALAAAEVIYPEPSAETLPTADEVYGILSRPVPEAAQEGARGVGGFPVEQPPGDRVNPEGFGPRGEG